MLRRYSAVLAAAVVLAVAPAWRATALDLGLDPAPPTVADDVCLEPTPWSTVCIEIEGRVVPDLYRPWRTTVEAHTRMCVSEGWSEVVCGFTTEDWGYVAGAGGACVQVGDLARPAACANGQDQCVLVVLGANRIVCD